MAIWAMILIVSACDRVQPDNPGKRTSAEQAAAEYQEPIRPGNVEGNPWWNGYAPRFLYAPVFKFNEVSGATSYRASITVTPVEGEAQTLTLDCASPEISLVPVWADITPGKVRMTVTGIGTDGQPAGLSGVKSPAGGPVYAYTPGYPVLEKLPGTGYELGIQQLSMQNHRIHHQHGVPACPVGSFLEE